MTLYNFQPYSYNWPCKVDSENTRRWWMFPIQMFTWHCVIPTDLLKFPKLIDNIQFNCKLGDNLCSAIIAIWNNRKATWKLYFLWFLVDFVHVYEYGNKLRFWKWTSLRYFINLFIWAWSRLSVNVSKTFEFVIYFLHMLIWVPFLYVGKSKFL